MCKSDGGFQGSANNDSTNDIAGDMLINAEVDIDLDELVINSEHLVGLDTRQ